MTTPQEDAELRGAIIRIVDGFRFDQEWITTRAADFPEHKGAGCGCGVCQKMVGLNHRVADCIMTFVAAHDEQLIKNFVNEFQTVAIPETDEYADGWNDCRKRVRSDLNRMANLDNPQEQIKGFVCLEEDDYKECM